MNRLNILILSGGLSYPIDDGAKLILFNLLKRLSTLHNITLLTLINSEDEKKYIPYINKYCRIETFMHKIRNTSFSRLRYMFSPLPYGINLHFNKQLMRRLKELVGREHFDIVQAQGLHMGHYLTGLGKIFKIIYAIDCDSLITYRRMKKAGLYQ